MITKAIIESLPTKYSAIIKIPFFNQMAGAAGSSSSSFDTYTAYFSVPPNSTINFSVGDIVYVAFEDNLNGKPVILGQLCRENKPDSAINLKAETLSASIDAYLPEYTYIGEVSPEEIKFLKGVNKNLQFQIDILNQRIAKLEEKVK